MKSRCSWILLFVFQFSHAANKVGNGGDVIFCQPPKSLATAELLDFYEQSVKVQSSQTDHLKIAERQLKALEEVAPKLSKQYLKRLKEISNEIEFKTEVALTDIKDSQHAFRPLDKNCKVLQIAIRKSQILSGEKRFLVREDLWQKLSPAHRAGLITHEIIYEHLSKLDEENSVKARRLNSYLYAKELKRSEFWSMIKQLELPIYP